MPLESILPRNNVGSAIYVEPTMLWKLTDQVAFNATFRQQVFVRSDINPGNRLDLDNFGRAQLRAKVYVGFQ